MSKDFLIIGFSKAKGFKPLSWLIMLEQNTKFSHAYIKLSNKHFGDFDIYQASKGLVNHVIDSTFLEENEVVQEFVIPIDTASKLEIIANIRKKLGRPYSVRALLGIFLYQRLNIEIKWLFDGDKAYICSELVARVLDSSGKISLDIDLDKATPKQLYSFCETNFDKN